MDLEAQHGLPVQESPDPAISASVVIPTYNRPGALAQCLEACIAQDYPPGQLEILVVEDGDQPAPNFALTDSRVRILRQNHTGPAGARNFGLKHAGGKLIAFTDDDCRPHPGWLRALAAAHRRSPRALLGGGVRNACGSNPYSTAGQLLIDFLYRDFQARASRQRFFTSNNLAGSRRIFANLNGFSVEFPMAAAEDRDLCDRWALTGGALLHVPDAVVDHHQDMNLHSFVARQFRYGRGARTLHRQRALRGMNYQVEPPWFYMRMLATPFRKAETKAETRNPCTVTALLCLSQATHLAGYFREALVSPRRRLRPHLASPHVNGA